MRLFGIAARSREDLEDLQAELGDAVTLLSDSGAQAIDTFGMLDPSLAPPRPKARAGTFFVDSSGTLRQRWLPSHSRIRPDPDEILAALN